MTQIAFTEVEKQDAARVKKQFPASVIHNKPLAKGGFSKCKDAEVLSVMLYSPIGEAELKKLPNLKLLCTRTVGFDHIDLKACQKRGVTVCNVPDYGSHVIAEHVFALLLGTLRHIEEGDERVEHGRFDFKGLRGMALKDKTIGIVGTGRIGRAAARIAHGFGMNIKAFDLYKVPEIEKRYGVEYCSLNKLFKASDIITLHLPANKHTKHMVNARALKQMKDGVVLVNTARGALIDTNSLVKALKSKKVAYALLDVLEHEKNFKENKELIEHPNAITTPHIAFYADDSMRNMYSDCFESIQTYLKGRKPKHTVQPIEKVPIK